jgi:hypothetical protein
LLAVLAKRVLLVLRLGVLEGVFVGHWKIKSNK